MHTTNELRDINGIVIQNDQDIVYVNKPEIIFRVIEMEDGELGHTEKFKSPYFSYQPFLRFLPSDDLKVFKIIAS